MTQQAQSGDTVRVHYIGTLDNGDRFDASVGGDPIEFTVGEGQVIPGFDKALEGMEIGESKKIRIPADEAYGPYREEMVLEIERETLPNSEELKEGQEVQLQNQSGQTFRAFVDELNDDAVTFDANHPLAGEALNFDLKLMEID